MKLYTEQEIRTFLNDVFFLSSSIDDAMDSLKPIELPSDDEILNEGKLVFNEQGKNIYTHYNTVPSWTEGAKWMRDKIKGDK